MAMLQFHQSRAVALLAKDDFHFAGLGEIGLITPFGCDPPRDDQAMWRLPDQDAAPVAFAAILLFAVAAAAHAAFDDSFRHRRFADVMRSRPPGVEAFGEDTEGAGGVGLNGDCFTYGCDFENFHLSLLHFLFECGERGGP